MTAPNSQPLEAAVRNYKEKAAIADAAHEAAVAGAEKLLSDSAGSLESALAQYKNSIFPWQKSLWGLYLTATIFSYEIALTRVSLARARNPFLQRLALKDMAHKIYEYELMLSQTYVGRLEQFAREASGTAQRSEFLAVRRGLRPALEEIKHFKDVRNKAGAHVCSDITEYLSLVESLNVQAVLDASAVAVKFSDAVLSVATKIIRARVESARR